jgi:hypothetical protein
MLIPFALRTEAIRSCEMSLPTRAKRPHIPGDDILHLYFFINEIKFKENYAFLWDVTPCGSSRNLGFGGTYDIHHQGGKNWRARNNISSN